MIQRRQTLYLIIILILTALTFVLPSSEVIISSQSSAYHDIYSVMPFDVKGITPESEVAESLFSTTYLGVIICFTMAWALLIIVMFKRRWLQIRLTIFLTMWLVGIEVLMVVYGYKLLGVLNPFSDIKSSFPMSWGAILPIISIVLSYLAFRGILKDELLVKSLNSNRMR